MFDKVQQVLKCCSLALEDILFLVKYQALIYHRKNRMKKTRKQNIRNNASHSPTHSMVPLTANPSGQLEKHFPLCEYRPSLHFVQKLRLKHASQFSILHSKMKKDIKSLIIILSRSIVNYEQVVNHLVVVALTVSYPKRILIQEC